MKQKEVTKLKGGEVLASPVHTKDYDILIPKGVAIKSQYIELLKSLDIGFVEIEDNYSCYENPTVLIEEKQKEYYIERIQKILENHIYTQKKSLQKIKELASDIIAYTANIDIESVYDYENKISNLYEHTLMVTILSLMVARKLNLSEKSCENIAIGCLLHDLGLRYITVPYINLDTNQISPQEVFEYKKHSILAYTVLDGENEWLPEISKKMILSHHEKMDGSGFPLKQKNQELECKIIQLCDTFDCFVSGMEYKQCSIEKVIHYLKEEAGKKYEESLIQNLLSFIAEYPVGTKVKLSNGRFGVVIQQTKQADRPIIIRLTNFDGEVMEKEIYNLEKLVDIQIKKEESNA